MTGDSNCPPCNSRWLRRRRTLERCRLPHRFTHAPHLRPARLRSGLPRHGADAGAEHDLSDLALDHARAGGRASISLGGVALGFVFYMLCAAFGITALLLAVPFAYDALRFAGAGYLLWLAWQAVKPGGRSPFQVTRACRSTARANCSRWAWSPTCSIRRSRCSIWRCCRSSSIPPPAAC